jgi:hypothetical protein
VSARNVVNLDDSDDEDWRPGYEDKEECKEQQSGWKKSKVKLSVTKSSQESATRASSFVAHSGASHPAMSDAPTQMDDTQSPMPPLVPYTASGGASAGAVAAAVLPRSKLTKRIIQPTLLSSPATAAAAATAIPADALLVGSQGAFVSFSSAPALAPSTAIKSSAHAALLSSTGAREAGKGKRKRAAETSDTIGAMLLQQQEESKHSINTIVLDDDDEDDSMPPLSAAVSFRRPSGAASKLASSHLVASRTVPLLERRAAAFGEGGEDDDEDEDDDDWRDEEEEQEERKQPAPARRKSKAIAKKPVALASLTSDFSAASSPSHSRSGAPAPSPASSTSVASATLARVQPPVVFNPAHLPSDEALAASDQEVGQRFQRMLADTQPVGTTTARQRASMPKDLLLQRNLEIQCQSLSVRGKGTCSLEPKLTFAVLSLYALCPPSQRCNIHWMRSTSPCCARSPRVGSIPEMTWTR